MIEESIKQVYDEIHAPEALLEKVMKIEKKGVRFMSAVKYAAAAMVVLLLCGSGVAYAGALGIFHFSTSHNGEANSGYRLTVESERISAEELSGGIPEVKTFLLEQKMQEDYEQTYPSWLKEYETADEARAYIGYSGLKETKPLGDTESVHVRVIGDTEGNPGEVSLFITYKQENLVLRESSQIFTETCPFESHVAGEEWTCEHSATYRNEEYTTKSGKAAVIVFEEFESGAKQSLQGFLVDGAVYYQLDILCDYTDFDAAKEILYQWFEQF